MKASAPAERAPRLGATATAAATAATTAAAPPPARCAADSDDDPSWRHVLPPQSFFCRTMQSRQWTSLICWAVVGSRFLGLASTHPFVSLAYFSLVFIFSLVVISLVVSCLPEHAKEAACASAESTCVAGRVCGDARVQRACQACSVRACSCARRRAARSARRHGDRKSALFLQTRTDQDALATALLNHQIGKLPYNVTSLTERLRTTRHNRRRRARHGASSF